MAENRPIIIKKGKKGHAGAHGGQWKVAYAAFMTAMMAPILERGWLKLDEFLGPISRAQGKNPGKTGNQPKNSELCGLSPGLQSRRQGAIVQIVQLAADRQAVRQTGHRHVKWGKTLRNIMGRGLTFDRRAHCQNDFFNFAFLEPMQKFINAQIGGPDPLQRRQRAAQHMIKSPEGSAALKRPKIGHILDHTDQCLIARRIAADFARILSAQIAADGAALHLLHRHLHGFDKRQH